MLPRLGCDLWSRDAAEAVADPGPTSLPEDVVAVRDLESLAEGLLSERTWNYVAGGAADEVSLGWNDSAWRELRLAPRVLADVSRVDTSDRAARDSRWRTRSSSRRLPRTASTTRRARQPCCAEPAPRRRWP